MKLGKCGKFCNFAHDTLLAVQWHHTICFQVQKCEPPEFAAGQSTMLLRCLSSELIFGFDI